MSDEKKIPTNCSDCGDKLTKAHELADGLCWMCGPGSARYQMKNPDYVHGRAEAESAAQPVQSGPKFCRISGLPLTMAHELELEMHYLHGPGSANWKKAHPEYEHTPEQYAALVKQFQQEKLNEAAGTVLAASAKGKKSKKSATA